MKCEFVKDFKKEDKTQMPNAEHNIIRVLQVQYMKTEHVIGRTKRFAVIATHAKNFESNNNHLICAFSLAREWRIS